MSRRDNAPIKVYCLQTEKDEIKEQAKSVGLTMSTFLLNVGMNYQIKSILDHKKISDLAKVNGDLGRLGGLLKMWLTDDERLAHFKKHDIEVTILDMMARINANQDQLRSIMTEIIKK